VNGTPFGVGTEVDWKTKTLPLSGVEPELPATQCDIVTTWLTPFSIIDFVFVFQDQLGGRHGGELLSGGAGDQLTLCGSTPIPLHGRRRLCTEPDRPPL